MLQENKKHAMQEMCGNHCWSSLSTLHLPRKPTFQDMPPSPKTHLQWHSFPTSLHIPICQLYQTTHPVCNIMNKNFVWNHLILSNTIQSNLIKWNTLKKLRKVKLLLCFPCMKCYLWYSSFFILFYFHFFWWTVWKVVSISLFQRILLKKVEEIDNNR